ncbi:MAG TPA: hypothetical protein GXX29_15350 [Firmicutes bacterium]|nr:hypothetical protein [Bacillota bacterium]
MTTDMCTWEAGIARLDITPPLWLTMAGFAGRDNYHVAGDVHDPLYVTALVLGTGAERVAIVSCDLLALEAEDTCRMREEIGAKTGISPQNVLIHTVHVHSGPLTSNLRTAGKRDTAYEAVLMRKIVSAVVLAEQRRRPVRLTLGWSSAPLGINRRERVGERIVLGDNPEGPVDHRIAALGIWPLETEERVKPLAVFYWVAVHPVMFGPTCLSYGRDYLGFATDRLEQAYPGMIGAALVGPCGNVNPRNFSSKTCGFAPAARMGEMLAGAVLAALAGAREIPAAAGLKAATHKVAVPLQPLRRADICKTQQSRVEYIRSHAKSAEEAQQQLVKDLLLMWADEALAALDGKIAGQPAESLTAELQIIVVGDLAIIGMPFEVFVEYQKDAEACSPLTDTLVVGCANGDFGYIPTKEAIAEGGYEVASAYINYGKLQPYSVEAPAVVRRGLQQLCRSVM